MQSQTIETSNDDGESYRYRYTDDAMRALDDFCSDYPSRDLKAMLADSARLIDIHDDGTVEYYEHLDVEVIGQWVFGTGWDNPEPYHSKNVSLVREILMHYCAVMHCASGYANRSYDSSVRFLNDEAGLETLSSSDRQLAIDCLKYPGLSKAAQTLIERRRHQTRVRKHDSARQAQHSRISPADWPDLFQPTETPLHFGTYNRVSYEALPDQIRELTDEQFVLVIPCEKCSDLDVSALTQRADSRLILRIDTDGNPVACEAFAGGALRIPIVANRNLLKKVRSHLAVAYVFPQHALFVEYPWSQMTLGKKRLEEAELLEQQARRDPALVSATLDGILPCRFMVNRIAGLAVGKPSLDVWMDDIPF
ncbi:hypothetical protein P0D69_43375 [Paraburkholderia sediminicola]|uniref:hypothetical protein n=1 Tax=Paraburkholderia TaxID=1822464 RepID=UPI001455F7C2|nr:hypothetical protein [Paraburkholderia aromaticivorans]